MVPWVFIGVTKILKKNGFKFAMQIILKKKMWGYGTILPFLAQYAHTCSYNEPAAATIHNDIHSQYIYYTYVMYNVHFILILM